jgi:hypothetical protein
MRTLRLSLVGTVIMALLVAVGAVGVGAQAPVTQQVSGMFEGWVRWEPTAPTDACNIEVRTITDALGETNLGTAVMHSEHCPANDPHDGEMTLYFEDGSSLTSTYTASCELVLPEGPSVLACDESMGEVIGGTGRFAGATGGLGYSTAMIWFPGTLRLVGIRWIGTITGSVTMAAPAPSAVPSESPAG